MQEAQFHIQGVAPLLMNNVQKADPQNYFAIEIAKITAVPQKKRTIEQVQRLERIQWEGGLYMDDEHGPIVPAEMIEATIINGAKTFRQGKQFTSDIYCKDNAPIIYDGPRDIEGMYADGRFKDRRMVVVNRAKVVGIRPIFPVWELKFTIVFNAIKPDALVSAVEAAGVTCALGDYRPRFGRFLILGVSGAAELPAAA